MENVRQRLLSLSHESLAGVALTLANKAGLNTSDIANPNDDPKPKNCCQGITNCGACIDNECIPCA